MQTATTERSWTCTLNLRCECIWKYLWWGRMKPPKLETLEPTNLLSPPTGGHRPRREGGFQHGLHAYAILQPPFCALPGKVSLLTVSPCSPWQEACGPFSQLHFTFLSAFCPSVLVTDAFCQSPPRGHRESLPRCPSQSRYSCRCWHFLTASAWPDLIGLYMSLPKKISGVIRGQEGLPGAPAHFPWSRAGK